MVREIDLRDFSTSRVTQNRIIELNSIASDVSNQLKESGSIRIEKFDPLTGNPSHIISEEKAIARDTDYITRAINHVQKIGRALGLTAQAPEFLADPVVQETSSGAKAVNLQQRFKGIPIFQAATTVRFDPKGALVDTVGSTVTVDQSTAVQPKLKVQEAVLKAAQYIAKPDADEMERKDQFGQPLPAKEVKISGFAPKVRAMFTNIPETPTVLEPGPFGEEIKASLIWFPLRSNLVLGWGIHITMPEYAGQYFTIVDADSGRILYCHQLMQFVAASGNVYRVDGGSARQMTNFPRPINDYGLPIPADAQRNWRWCKKCQGLHFAGNTGSKCPAGGSHEQTGSADYYLVQNSPSYPGQNNWRWCKKCQGLFFAGNTGSKCPAGGSHDSSGSGNYTLLHNTPLASGQHNWRWCKKCQGLFFAGNSGSKCPAGGSHDSSGSGDYSLVSAPSGLPAGFPDTWVANAETDGNSVRAHLGESGATCKGKLQGGAVTFNPADAVGDDQKVLNIFYYSCVMHDFFYLLKFRESDGNFQKENFGRGGSGGDAVNACSHPGAVWGTANFGTPADGTAPIMNMGMLTSTNRHTAFDSSVVFHEFTHGVTKRLVGGPMNVHALDSPQSGGMGEGWGDYIACTINNSLVVGNWVLNNPKGIRYFPYDSNYPHNFGDLGKTVAGIDYSEVHNMGEIWCATLMEMNRKTNKHLAVQLVVDALKLSPANPSFLDMRDAILSALNNMLLAGRINANQRDGAWQGIWMAFARFGMGPQAASNGAQVTGIKADYTIGQDNWRMCKKCQGMFFAGNPGSKCPAGGSHDATSSGNYDIPQGMPNWASVPGQSNWRWCKKCQGMFFGGNATDGVCPAGGTHNHTGSGDYKLIFNAWGSPAQSNWRMCKKCQGLFFAGNSGSKCPAGGSHDSSGSGDYSLMSRG